MRYRFITIDGNIGAGKTTLANILAQRLNAKPMLEDFADNPFLPGFYANPDRYAFQLELYFLAERYKQFQQFLPEGDLFHPVIISDYLFAKSLLFAKITLQEEEFKLYQRLFQIIYRQLTEPDILIFLYAPILKLQENIKKRNRSYEQQIPDEYLSKIQGMYAEYIQQSNLITFYVDVSHADFIGNEEHIKVIESALEKDYTPGRYYLTLP